MKHNWLAVIVLAGFFIEAGVAYHPMAIDCPEYCGSNPLVDIGAGYTFEISDMWFVDTYYKHRSSAPDVEDGYGHNLVGIRARRYFKEK